MRTDVRIFPLSSGDWEDSQRRHKPTRIVPLARGILVVVSKAKIAGDPTAVVLVGGPRTTADEGGQACYITLPECSVENPETHQLHANSPELRDLQSKFEAGMTIDLGSGAYAEVGCFEGQSAVLVKEGTAEGPEPNGGAYLVAFKAEQGKRSKAAADTTAKTA